MAKFEFDHVEHDLAINIYLQPLYLHFVSEALKIDIEHYFCFGLTENLFQIAPSSVWCDTQQSVITTLDMINWYNRARAVILLNISNVTMTHNGLELL